MLATWDGFLGFQRCRVYLEDDRVEVGRMGFAYIEDLSRVAYRDVHAVSFTPAWHAVRLLQSGLFGALAVLALVIGGSVGSGGVPPVAAGIALAFAVAAGWFGVWGRRGSVLRFRVEGIRGGVAGGVSGRRVTRERFRAALLERIDASKARAVQQVPGAAPAPPPLT